MRTRRKTLPNWTSSGRSHGLGGFIAIVVLVLVGLAFVGLIVYRSTATEVTFTVEDKERVCDRGTDGRQNCRYLIFTDKGTYQVTDSWAYLRFNSSDVYGRLKEGKTYEAEVVGWRLPFFSRYKNIVEATEVRQ